MNPILESIDDEHRVSTVEQLESLYGEASAGALAKEIDYISDHYRAFIDASPFVLVATSGEAGLDCSPRGDPAGFVRVEDPKTLLLPDRRGNNRLDTLRNLLVDPRISLLFLIPGIGETLRVNGTAEIVSDPAIREPFVINGKVPATVVVVSVLTVYFQCRKAIVRSKLWDPDSHVDRSTLPSAGTILQSLSKEPFDGRAYDDEYPARMKKTIY